jgi:hypothetical protein
MCVEGRNKQFDQLLFNGIIRVGQVKLFDVVLPAVPDSQFNRKMAERKLALRQNLRVIGLCRRIAGFRLCLRLFVSFRGQLRRYGLL